MTIQEACHGEGREKHLRVLKQEVDLSLFLANCIVLSLFMRQRQIPSGWGYYNCHAYK